MKKVCFFIGDIEKSGGTERVTTLIANRLVKERYDISILSYRNGESSFFELDNNIKLYSLHLEKNKGYFSRKIIPYLILIKFFKTNHFDIIVNVDVILSLYTLPIKRIINSKIVSWEHFNYKVNNGVKNRDKARILSAAKADYIIVLTKADKLNYENNLKIKCPIINIYNPIVDNIDKFSNKENIFIAAGRLSFPKNFEELIDIWNIVEKKYENLNWRLIICGSGEEETILKDKIKTYGLKHIEMPGFCKNISEYFKKSKVYLMTSRYEGFPMVLLEAQQYGLPIISYNCETGPSEIIIDNRNGFLIKPGDIETFANKIIYYIKNKKVLDEHSKNAYFDCDRFTIDNIINDWIYVFDELCK